MEQIAVCDTSPASLSKITSEQNVKGYTDFEAAIEMLSKPSVNLSKIVTHTYSLDEIDEGFKTAYDKSTGSLKVHITQ